MSLELYAVYSRAAALDALGIAEAPRLEWSGKLVLHSATHALFVTLGPAETAPHFQTPDEFRFRPDQAYSIGGAENHWIPQELTAHGGERRELHLLVREGREDSFRYVGLVDLQMYTLPGDYRQQRAEFLLEPRLSRGLWLRYGGYPGWKLTRNHREQFLAQDDEAGLATCLDETTDQAEIHLSLTRYEGNCLTLRANESQAYLSYLDEWGGEALSRNPEYPDDTEEIADFYCSCGAALEMPLCYVLPRTLGLDVVREFFATGHRPNRIAWFEG